MFSRSILLRLALIPAFFCFFAKDANGQEKQDPGSLLQAVSHKYSQARYYHIEAIVSEELKGESSGNWSNSFQTAWVAPGGRYRFSVREPHISWLQVSDGKNEWVYKETAREYVKRPTPADGKPSQFGKTWSNDEELLIDAHDIPEHVMGEIGSLRDPRLVGSEVLTIHDGNLDCFVIRGQGRYHSGWLPDTKLELTFWIEKSSNYVRKIEEQWDGELIRGDSSHYTRAQTEVYPIVDLKAAPLPSVFEFRAPTEAKLVVGFKETTPLLQRPRIGLSIVGRTAPELSFRSPDGQVVHLSSLRGKPVLIEFWATWCGPCVAAFANVEQLYSQAMKGGIVVITIDEDEEPEKANAFLANHRKFRWTNYHDDGEINRSLPGDGLPQFVLIDASGKIVHSESGFDEHELRTALGQLSLDSDTVSKKAN